MAPARRLGAARVGGGGADRAARAARGIPRQPAPGVDCRPGLSGAPPWWIPAAPAGADPAAGPVFLVAAAGCGARLSAGRPVPCARTPCSCPISAPGSPNAGDVRGDDTARALRWLAGCGAARVLLAGGESLTSVAGGSSAPVWVCDYRPLGLLASAVGANCAGARSCSADIDCPCCRQVARPASETRLRPFAATTSGRMRRSGAGGGLSLAGASGERHRLLARQRDLGRDCTLDVWRAREALDRRRASPPSTRCQRGMGTPARPVRGCSADGRRWREPAWRPAADMPAPARTTCDSGEPRHRTFSRPGHHRMASSLMLLYAGAGVGEAPPPGRAVMPPAACCDC